MPHFSQLSYGMVVTVTRGSPPQHSIFWKLPVGTGHAGREFPAKDIHHALSHIPIVVGTIPLFGSPSNHAYNMSTYEVEKENWIR
jgi:hypothetical protein